MTRQILKRGCKRLFYGGKYSDMIVTIKIIFDFIFALLCLFISLPFWFIFILIIWLEDGWPVFYLQERVGLNGKIFISIKFRSMVKDAEVKMGPLQAEENDMRVLKIGKFLRQTALDELPQLISILKGQMSFVGPRALRLIEREVNDNTLRSIFDYPTFKERIRVRPGLTGIAQVFAPRDLPRETKFKYDLWYIQNRNFILDVYIVVLSFLISFRKRWEIRNDKFNFLTRLKQKINAEVNIENDILSHKL